MVYSQPSADYVKKAVDPFAFSNDELSEFAHLVWRYPPKRSVTASPDVCPNNRSMPTTCRSASVGDRQPLPSSRSNSAATAAPRHGNRAEQSVLGGPTRSPESTSLHPARRRLDCHCAGPVALCRSQAAGTSPGRGVPPERGMSGSDAPRCLGRGSTVLLTNAPEGPRCRCSGVVTTSAAMPALLPPTASSHGSSPSVPLGAAAQSRCLSR